MSSVPRKARLGGGFGENLDHGGQRSSDPGGRSGESAKGTGMESQAQSRRDRIERVDVDAENFQRLAGAGNVKSLAMNRDSRSWW